MGILELMGLLVAIIIILAVATFLIKSGIADESPLIYVIIILIIAGLLQVLGLA